MSSWQSKPNRDFKTSPTRLRAANYANKRFKRDDVCWLICFKSFLAGWCDSNRAIHKRIHLKVKLLKEDI